MPASQVPRIIGSVPLDGPFDDNVDMEAPVIGDDYAHGAQDIGAPSSSDHAVGNADLPSGSASAGSPAAQKKFTAPTTSFYGKAVEQPKLGQPKLGKAL